MSRSVPFLLSLLLLFLLLNGCGPSLYGEMFRIRAEIDELERDLPENAPLWISTEEAAKRPNLTEDDVFDQYLNDGTPYVPDFIYRHVLGKLSVMATMEIETLAEGDFPYDAVLKDPAPFRGRIYRITGIVYSLDREEYRDNLTGIEEVFTGIAYREGSKPFLFHLLNKPEVLHPHEDLVEVHGVFVKIISVGSPGQRLRAPLFLARSAKRYI
jgi:hypothetical protein